MIYEPQGNKDEEVRDKRSEQANIRIEQEEMEKWFILLELNTKLLPLILGGGWSSLSIVPKVATDSIDVKKVEEAIFSQKYKALSRILQLDKGSPYSSLQKKDFPVLESYGIPVDDCHVHIAVFCDLYRVKKVCKKTTTMDVVL